MNFNADSSRSGTLDPGDPMDRSEEMARKVLHKLAQPVFVLDSTDTVLFANRAMVERYSLASEQLRGQAFQDLLGSGPQQKRLINLVGKARRDGSARFAGMVEFPVAGKRYLDCLLHRLDLPGDAAEPLVMIECRDMTEQHELDQRRRRSLMAQEQLLSNIPAMIWVSGSDAKPYFYNDTWLDFTGLSQFEQTRDGWLELVHGEDRELVQEQIQEAITTLEPTEIRFRLLSRTGEYRWMRMEARTIVNDEDGSLSSLVACCVDIHNARMREMELRQSLDEEHYLREVALQQKAEADRASREKSAYLSLASHEIRTPLNPVIGFADLLVSNPDLDPESQEMAQMILKAGRNLLSLIDDILDYAKIDSGGLKLMPEPVDVPDLLLELEGQYRFEAQTRGIDLRVDCDESLQDELFQDRMRLHQILGTMLMYAIRSTPAGRVHLEATDENGDMTGRKLLIFRVRDSGLGLKEEELEDFFKPFRRVEKDFGDQHKGSGLGLAIVRKLVEMMNGTIAVSSERGEGTMFEVAIPMTPVPEQFRAKTAETGSASGKAGAAKSSAKQAEAKVMIIDDEGSSRLVHRSLMEFLGYRSDEAANSAELFQKMALKSYPILLVDIMMPGLDGLEIVRRIRNGEAGEGNRDAYIVGVTACGEDEDRERALRAGMDACITKPLTVQGLRQVLRVYHERMGALRASTAG